MLASDSQAVSCYSTHMKAHPVITETPRRSGSLSPRKRSPIGRISEIPASISELIGSLDYEDSSALGTIPEREWRLLTVLARKREEDDERERLADEFRRMWQKEKEERNMAEAETSEQYKKFLYQKREEERWLIEHKRLQRIAQQQQKTGQLLNCIRSKEQRTAEMIAWMDDKKASNLLSKAIEDQARAELAADRRSRLGAANEWRRRVEFVDLQLRAEAAERRRNAILRNASQRAAISNALNTWESSRLRVELLALEAAKRAHHAASAAFTSVKSMRLARAREHQIKRARKIAMVTAQMREAIRGGRR